MKIKTTLFLLLLIFVFVAGSYSEELDGKKIIEKMRDRASSDSLIMQVQMIITDKRGEERKRSIINRMKDSPKGGKTVVTFIKPDDVKGTKFLIVENKNGNDDQMLYMPALKKVKRITSKQKSGKFMGTDFTYADLQSHDPEKGTHTRLADETIDGHDCYKVRTIPKNPDEYDYSKIVYWVRKDNDIPVKSEFYDMSGELLKVLNVTKIEKDEKGNWVIRDSLMKNVQKNTSTRMKILQYKTDAKLSDDYFTERFLADETQM